MLFQIRISVLEGVEFISRLIKHLAGPRLSQQSGIHARTDAWLSLLYYLYLLYCIERAYGKVEVR